MNNDKSPNWNTYGDHDEPDTDDSGAIKRTPDFFSSFLAERINNESESEEKEDDEENSKKKKKKKKPSIFSQLLPPVKEASEEKSGSSDESAPQILSAEQSQFQAMQETAATSDTNNESSQDFPEESSHDQAEVSPDDLESIDNSDNIPQTPEDVPSNIDTSVKIESEELLSVADAKAVESHISDNEIKIQHDEEPKISHEPEDDKQDSLTQPPSVPPPIVNSVPGTSYNNDPLTHQTTEGISQDRVERETIIEKKPVGAVLAFLAAETLSRRRDRKIRREMREQKKEAEKEVAEVKKSQMTQQEAQRKLSEHQEVQAAKLSKVEANLVSQRPEPVEVVERGQTVPKSEAISEDPSDIVSIKEVLAAQPLLARSEAVKRHLAEEKRDASNSIEAPQAILMPPIGVETKRETQKPDSYQEQKADNPVKQRGYENNGGENKVEQYRPTEPARQETLYRRPRQRVFGSARLDQSKVIENSQGSAESSLYNPEIRNRVSPSQTSSVSTPTQLIKSYKQPIQMGFFGAILLMVIFLVVYILL